MNANSRLPAALAYLPIIGWLIVFLFQRRSAFALYHLRQAVGLVLFLIGSVIAWAVVAWLLAWIPLLAVLSAALFALVIAAWLFGAITLILGVVNALNQRMTPLPGFGQWAARLPIR